MNKKKVAFGTVTINKMYVWSFAYQEARKGRWHLLRVDNDRFRRRIDQIDCIISPVLENKQSKMDQVSLRNC